MSRPVLFHIDDGIARLQEAESGPFDHQGRQRPGYIGACVDADSVGLDDGLFLRRMAVDDHLAVETARREERFPNPEEIGGLLLFQRHPGADPRMGEVEITQLIAQLQPLKDARCVLGNAAVNL